MNIVLNGQSINTACSNLKDFLLEQSIDITCVASAIDGDFVPRRCYEETQLEDNMKIEVVAPMQGG
ncbi:sulfur carrier protein ThiS [Acinetobacter sp. HY1485]|uniref:sulfur carrier protein ThiS n=1 Tax=Acinetobacter sp. HY1485 TaxID=2970918 RepID=UPI0022B963F9|nr:sulfur carrier protein ThiS [Acinetobacter sp. HY1485]